jgi:5-methylthioadenosine/S-adenosylhomocysteine deaminase
VLEGHAVALRGATIEAVLPAPQALERYPDAATIDLPDHVLMPGLVNSHTRASPGACAEMLAGGITAIYDRSPSPQPALNAGLRVTLGLGVSESPSDYACDAADYLRKGLELRDAYRDEPRVSFCLAPDAELADANLRQVATLAAELDLPVHIELVATRGMRALERLQRLGMLGPQLAALGAGDLEKHEIELLGRHSCTVVHCPSSDAKRANALAPVQALQRAGANVCLGTGDAARLDLFQEMRLCALSTHAVLRAATLSGAEALGIAAHIGSIVPGKQADLVAVSLPRRDDPAAQLVSVAGREHVTHVWLAGVLQTSDSYGKMPQGVTQTLDSNRFSITSGE